MPPDRKTEILSAAGSCFIKYGYEKTTLDDIARMVGINKASFYYYFENKEAIFTELITREADEYILRLKAKTESIPDFRDKVLTWIKEGFRYNNTDSILHRLSVESLTKLTPLLAKLNEYSKKKAVEFMTELISDHREKGDISKRADPSETAEIIINVVFALKDQAYRATGPGNGGDPPEFGKTIESIVLTVSMILDGIIPEKSK